MWKTVFFRFNTVGQGSMCNDEFVFNFNLFNDINFISSFYYFNVPFNLNYPKEKSANILKRCEIIEQCEKDLILRALILEQCEKDCLFWINMFAWTHNPRLNQSLLPFITYPFQDTHINNLIKGIENGEDIAIEKSRDMGASWLIVGLQTWAWRFKSWSSLYGSYKETYVDQQGNMDSHFERIRFVIEKLPKWMLPNDMITKYMHVSSKELGASIDGDSGSNFGTGGRRKFVIADEFALWQHDSTAFRKTKDVTNCRIFQGTPEGRFNVYGKIMTQHKDYRHLEITKLRLHWKDHPLKTKEWYEAECRKRTRLDIAKELDISYDDSVTGAVYKDFTQICKLGDFKFNPRLPLFTSWDFGLDMNAIIWFQKDYGTDQIYIIDTVQRENKQVDYMAAFVTGQMSQNYTYPPEDVEIINRHDEWRFAYSNHFGDPYNIDNRNTTGGAGITIRKTLSNLGINFKTCRKSTVEARIRKVHLAQERTNINEDLHEFIQAITQSRYPQRSETSQSTKESTKPIHDVNSHYRTAWEYGIDNEPAKYDNRGSLDAQMEFYQD